MNQTVQTTQHPQPGRANGSGAAINDPILEIKDLKTYFFLERGTVKAVNGVNLTLGRQSTLGIVGERGWRCSTGRLPPKIQGAWLFREMWFDDK